MATFKLTPTRRRQIGIGFLSILVLVAWIKLLILPQQKSLAEDRTRIKGLQPKVTAFRQKLIQLPHIESEISRLSSLHKLPMVRPMEEQLPQLLDLIAQTAHLSGVRLRAVKPSMEDLSHLTAGPSGFIELPIQVEAVSGYEEMIEFLHALETSEILVRGKTLEIKADPKDFSHHPANLLLEAYLPPSLEGTKR